MVLRTLAPSGGACGYPGYGTGWLLTGVISATVTPAPGCRNFWRWTMLRDQAREPDVVPADRHRHEVRRHAQRGNLLRGRSEVFAAEHATPRKTGAYAAGMPAIRSLRADSGVDGRRRFGDRAAAARGGRHPRPVSGRRDSHAPDAA